MQSCFFRCGYLAFVLFIVWVCLLCPQNGDRSLVSLASAPRIKCCSFLQPDHLKITMTVSLHPSPTLPDFPVIAFYISWELAVPQHGLEMMSPRLLHYSLALAELTSGESKISFAFFSPNGHHNGSSVHRLGWYGRYPAGRCCGSSDHVDSCRINSPILDHQGIVPCPSEGEEKCHHPQSSPQSGRDSTPPVNLDNQHCIIL